MTQIASRVLALKPVSMMLFIVKTCSIQLISHCVNANKIAPTSVKEVKKTRLSLHVGVESCYYKSHRVYWPLVQKMYENTNHDEKRQKATFFFRKIKEELVPNISK